MLPEQLEPLFATTVVTFLYLRCDAVPNFDDKPGGAVGGLVLLAASIEDADRREEEEEEEAESPR